jgi:hypothetical protein
MVESFAVSSEYTTNPARRVIYMRMWGAVTLADFRASDLSELHFRTPQRDAFPLI